MNSGLPSSPLASTSIDFQNHASIFNKSFEESRSLIEKNFSITPYTSDDDSFISTLERKKIYETGVEPQKKYSSKPEELNMDILTLKRINDPIDTPGSSSCDSGFKSDYICGVSTKLYQ